MQQLSNVLQQGADQISADVDAVIAQCRVLRRSIRELRDDLFRYEGITVADNSDEAPGEELGDSGEEQTAYYDTSAFQQGKVTLCTNRGLVEADNSVGGIVGQGCDIFYSYAYPSVESEGECSGSIAGRLQEEGILSGNYYVRGNVPGVDAIGYEGGAAPLSYEEFCSSEGVPAAFSEFTVSFQADGRELASFQCRYGEAIDPAAIPAVPEKEGSYGFWPEFDFSCVTGNRVLEAQYENWVSSLASAERDEEGRARVLVQGEFLPEMQLVLRETAEGMEITVEGIEETGDFAGSMIVRAVCADPENTTVELYENGRYRRIPAEVMGSYVEFTMENSGTFRLTETAGGGRWILFAAAGAAVLVLIIVLIVKGIRKGFRKNK